MSQMRRIELLGKLQVTQEDSTITHFETRKTAALLALLALALPKSCSREALAEILWPDEDPEATRTRLRQALSALRRTLEPTGSGNAAPPVLIADRIQIRLDPQAVTTDVAEFEAAFRAARAGSLEERRRFLEQAAALYTGELLPGYYEETVLTARQRLAETHRGVLIDLSAILGEWEEHPAAIQAAKQAVAADPLEEDAHCALIRAYNSAGRPSEALRAARELEQVLRKEFDAVPSGATRALIQEVQAGSSVAKTTLPALPALIAPALIAPALIAPTLASPKRVPALWLTAAVFGIVLALTGLLLWPRITPTLPDHRARDAKKRTVAVLPFEIISDNSAKDAYFADGLTEEMTNRLGKIQALTVLGRISAARIKDSLTTGGSPLAQELNVGTLITGKVSREPQKMRIYVEAIDAQTQHTIWSEEYDAPFQADKVLEVETEVVGRVARSLSVRLTAEEQGQVTHKFTDNFAAYDFYLQGRYLWNQRTETSLKHAVTFFQKAIALDSHFAPAYVGEADAYDVLGYYGYMDSEAAYRQSCRAADTALASASGDTDTQAAAYTSLAWAEMVYRRNGTQAETDFQEALRLSPDYATAHQWHSLLLMLQGRSGESLAEIFVALRHDPLSFIIETSVGGRYYHAGQYARAIEQYDQVLALNPDYSVAYFWRGLAEEKLAKEKQGSHRQAAADLSAAVAGSHRSALFLAFLAHDEAVSGKRAQAKAIRDELQRRAATEYVSPFCLALTAFSVGDQDTGFRWLKRAYETHDGTLTFLEEAAPAFEDLRREPRFRAIQKQMGLH